MSASDGRVNPGTVRRAACRAQGTTLYPATGPRRRGRSPVGSVFREEAHLHIIIHPQVLPRGVANRRRREAVDHLLVGDDLLGVDPLAIDRFELPQPVSVLPQTRLA